MQTKITRDDWSQWVNSPVTQAIMAELAEARNEAINKLLNLEAAKLGIEKTALEYLALRHWIDGFSQSTDLQNLEYLLVEEETDERA